MERRLPVSGLERCSGCRAECSEASLRPASEILRCAQDDMHDLQMSEEKQRCLLLLRKRSVKLSHGESLHLMEWEHHREKALRICTGAIILSHIQHLAGFYRIPRLSEFARVLSFCPEGGDRVEARGSHRRVEPEADADDRCHAESNQDPEVTHDQWQAQGC